MMDVEMGTSLLTCSPYQLIPLDTLLKILEIPQWNHPAMRANLLYEHPGKIAYIYSV